MFSKISKVDINVLAQLISQLCYLLEQHDLVIDSRKITKNSIFCAYPGTKVDGRQFMQIALDNGAKTILYEASCDSSNETIASLSETAKAIPVVNLKLYVGLLAAQKYDNPSKKVKTIGVTGTNGKTSIAYWLNQVYTLLEQKTAMIGTLGAGIYPEIVSHAITTPDPITLENLLAKFADSKVNVVAMEVSSHALDQGRVNGVNFATAVFTNLTQDHLDYHINMENYFLAKQQLFYWYGLRNAVINIDDHYGLRLYDELTKSIKSTENININILEPKAVNAPLKILTYGVIRGDVRASNIKITLSGTEFNLEYESSSVVVAVKVIGKFNVYNLLAVSSILLLDGYSLAEIAKVLPSLTPVCGRMDAIIVPNKPLIVVDFSHTPDSLENALLTLKEVEHSGKIYCIFGCGGNRDNLKRPIMGEIAARLADKVIVTSDNPRFENPSDIIDQIVAGIKDVPYQRIENRKEAIESVLKIAKADDIILIAGKGHENYQEINGIKEPFSDFVIAKEYLNN